MEWCVMDSWGINHTQKENRHLELHRKACFSLFIQVGIANHCQIRSSLGISATRQN